MSIQNKTAVITGATGMLGLALIRILTREGWKIYAVSRRGSKRLGNIPISDNVNVVECDLSEIGILPQLIDEPCGVFFHLGWDGTYGASRNDMQLQTENISAAVSAVRAAKELSCEVFLGAGSQAEYGRKSEKISPDTPVFPETGYGIAKLCAGQMTRVVCGELSIRHIWCRIFSVYGPYDGAQTMVMSGISKLLAGERPSYTKGEQQWDYLYCDDAAEAMLLAAEKGKDGGIYCIGSGKTRRLSEYIHSIRDAVAPSAEVGLGDIPYAEKQVMYLCADISSLVEDTGFSPRYSFEDGISLTAEWYKGIKEKQK